MKLDEVAQIVGLSRRTVEYLVKAGQFPQPFAPVLPGRTKRNYPRWFRADIEKFLRGEWQPVAAGGAR
jgi:predicted DNA-binding transcriptional regulator AlpA